MNLTSYRFVFRCLLALISFFSIGYLTCTLTDLYQYFYLSSYAEPIEVDWQVKQLEGGQFSVIPSYRFLIGNRLVEGKTFSCQKKYKSEQAAESDKNIFRLEPHRVWYNSKNININSLGKQFPMKHLVISAIFLGVLLYFYVLYQYVNARMDQSRKDYGIKNFKN